MAVNWIGLIGENNIMIPREEITIHSLTHNKATGYRFSNPPNKKYFERWQPIFFQGGLLQEHWKQAEKQENSPYIFMPFCDDYIFIYLEKKQSGNRIATILHSKICPNGNYLAEQCIKTMGEMKSPSPQGIGISINDEYLAIPSSKNSGIGLSSWLFLNKKIKSSIGVSSGVPVNLLNTIFPEVSSWLVEDESQTFVEAEEIQKFPILQLIRNYPEPRLAVNDFLMLEKISSVFKIDMEMLIQIFLKDKGVRVEIDTSVEIEFRIILGDRDGALDLVINENKLLNKWMNQPKMKYNDVLFPFTINELSIIESEIGDDKFTFLRSCFDLMTDYSTESKIEMAKILTRHGSQEVLEQIWNSIDSSHQDLINGNLDELFLWRTNPNINNFWKIIEAIEGSNIRVESNSKRLLLGKIISHSVTSSDLTGIMHYVPDILNDKNKYEFDWDIMIKIESNYHKILLKINEIYPSSFSIQKRILLYINRKLDSKKPWRIQDFLPSHKKNLVKEKNWMRPLLDSLDERRGIYSIQMPSDAYDWIPPLSPSQYLEALNDSILIKYLLDRKRPESLLKMSLAWPNPKALSNSLTDDAPTWEKRREWAKLCFNPSISQRIRYYQDNVQYGISFTFFVITLFTFINAVILINENELFKTFFDFLPLTLIELINQIFWPILELFAINFNDYSIPLLNNPVLFSLIAVIFCLITRYFFLSAKQKRIEKLDYINKLQK
jgi:hypothetical protein